MPHSIVLLHHGSVHACLVPLFVASWKRACMPRYIVVISNSKYIHELQEGSDLNIGVTGIYMYQN